MGELGLEHFIMKLFENGVCNMPSFFYLFFFFFCLSQNDKLFLRNVELTDMGVTCHKVVHNIPNKSL